MSIEKKDSPVKGENDENLALMARRMKMLSREA